MKPKVMKVAKIGQGDSNPDSPWAKEQFYLLKQLNKFWKAGSNKSEGSSCSSDRS